MGFGVTVWAASDAQTVEVVEKVIWYLEFPFEMDTKGAHTGYGSAR